MTRRILFAEVPSFYATIERAEDPALSDRPVIVGGDPRKRGLVQSASADALAAGVELDMPVIEALRLCPGARALRTDMARYRAVSRRLFACLRRTHARLETFGLGAAYLDVSAAAEPAGEIAEQLRAGVESELSLPLRVGIASSKHLARLAAEEAGAAGVRVLAPGEELAFLHPLPATRLEGVGRKTAAMLAELGAHTIGQVEALGRESLQERLGTHGLRIHDYASGRDDTPVRAARHPQSLSREATLQSEPLDLAVLQEHLHDLARRLEAELHLQALAAGKVTLKLRFADQGTTTRSRTLPTPASRAEEIQRVATELLARTQAGSRPARAVGIQLAGLALAEETDRQLDLFSSDS